MSIEALVLALTAVIRPTTVGAVFAMLRARHPQRLLMGFLLAGLAVSLAVGILVVVTLQGLTSSGPLAATRPVLDIALGAGALAYAVGTWTGALPRRRVGEPSGSAMWMRRRLQDLRPSGAAMAGVLTHLPGLVYLAALNAIASSATGTADGIVQVVVYNAIWFSLPIVALVLSVHRPNVSQDLLDRTATWSRRHRRVLVTVFFGALGGYLVVTGVVG
ncbi:GAP family protein [Pseudonocardia asaccharolytica]|uniref:GAP family protein n=1 Tax=Pseudonocardia asaccharolytica DSM 44247 = NBRC 16224 TaxID=1123024 RepID=A0A511D4Q3_9PSEU|nr:GAP family protein [Pseudonocardia asaccharolytica]GEL19779.1 hypothetical protein PA7_36160 [Pseudonocardia asaccharolytica DSM 44247 = NBRC 16224]